MIRAHALILLALVLLVIVLLALRPKPLLVQSIKATPAGVVWLYRYEAPPTFCTTPLPICQGGKCPKKKEVVT